MARTEKKFGTANQVSSTQVTTLVTPSANRKNVIINAAGRGTGTLDIAVTSGNGTMTLGAPTSTTSAVTTTSRSSFITSVNTTAYNPDGNNNYYNGAAFNKEMTRMAWFALGNTHDIASGVVNPSTGAMTGIAAQSYQGGGSNYYYYHTQYYATYPMPGSNNIKMYGTAGVASDVATNGNPGQTLYSGFGAARYNAISSSSSYNQWAGAYLNTSGSWTYYSGSAYAGVQGHNYDRDIGLITIPNHTNPKIAKGVYVFSDPDEAYYGYPQLRFRQAYADGTPNGNLSQQGPYYYAGVSRNDIGYHASNIFPFSYNNQLNHWAISLTTNGYGHGAQWDGGSITRYMASKSSANNPGFRINVDDSGASDEATRAFFQGTDKTPAVPTGVTVPDSNRPLRSIKFSPDGTKLAVAYNRDYTGNGITNSVIVIYTWNAGTLTWEHTHSSGSAIPHRPYNNDCMVWASDSSLLAIAGTDGVIRMWGPGFTATSSKVAVGISNGPAMTSLLSGGIASPVAHASTFTGSLNAGTGLTVNGNHPGSWVRELIYAPTAGSPYRFVAILGHGATATLTSGNHTTVVDGVTTANVAVNNYVSSVASNLPIVDGNVTQITGVVLEANEGLAVEASVSGIVDVNAYGVEIS
jgi:hypothetical protein